MPNILIVDDEPENLRSLKRYLEDAMPDWDVSTSQNEKEAAVIMKDCQPDIVISDLVMATEQGGMKVLRQAKEKDPLIMVILVTAFEKKLERYRAFELGAFDCIQKNMPGLIAAEEILVKTKAALQFREMAMNQIKNQQRLTFLKRYFDPRVFGMIEREPNLLNIRQQTVTICFWDIRGFSGLCEILKAHPTLISDFLKDYFRVASEVIFKHQGVLDKFIGDGVMAIFGALNHKDDKGHKDAINAVKSSIDLRRDFNKVLKDWMKQWVLYTPCDIDVGLGCGIHTGEVLVGNVGTDAREQFTAIGPHVNFAQRLESRANIDQILISASTSARVGKQFNLKEFGIIDDVRHIPGKFRIFEVVEPEEKKGLFLEDALREKFEAEEKIKEFYKEMTFLIIDIAGSTKIKKDKDGADIVYTFNKYHNYVREIVDKNKGDVVWSGDGGLCTFQNPDKAVETAIQIQEGLDDFNKDEARNRLEKPIMVR
ncbi:MAG: adenylate/guanylate cyclase domain-containing protein, partial [Candidatus Desantisbacteria bacterium]